VWLAAVTVLYLNLLQDGVDTFFPVFARDIGISLAVVGLLRACKSAAAIGIRFSAPLLLRVVDQLLAFVVAVLGGLGVLAALAIVGAACLCIVGPWVVRLVFLPADVPVTTALLPWYAGAMIPLALANVMVNDLMARGRYRIVPFMIVIAIAYGFTLPYMCNHYPRMQVALQTLGAFNLVLFVVCAWFTWGMKEKPAAESAK